MTEADVGRVVWVRVVIVNYNGGLVLQRCLDHLAGQTLTDFEAVIVDNGSNDGSLDAIRVPDTRFRLVRAGRNLGFAAANNLGARDCRAPWLATLNPDAFAEPGWLEALRQATQRYPDVAMFGSTQIDAGDPQRLDGCGDIYSAFGMPWRGGYQYPLNALPPDGEPFAPCAAAALYRLCDFVAVGGFDEAFFCYLEDVDLGYRLRLLGCRCVQVAGARVHHLGSEISGPASWFKLFHSYRNRVWLVFKNTPFPLVLVLLPLHLAASCYMLARPRHIQDIGPCLGGIYAGLCGLPKRWASRVDSQRRRRISNFRVARALTWSIAKLQARSIDLRPR
jgi:GT2 family glycosyltransferase